MKRCVQYLHGATESAELGEVSFSLPQLASHNDSAVWARFCAVLFREQLVDTANEFWAYMGDGISSRHAEFCLERFSFMESVSPESSLQTAATNVDVEKLPAAPWDHSDAGAKLEIRQIIAKLVASQRQLQPIVRPENVFLFPKGMCAIGTVARQLVPTNVQSSEAVVFG